MIGKNDLSHNFARIDLSVMEKICVNSIVTEKNNIYRHTHIYEVAMEEAFRHPEQKLEHITTARGEAEHLQEASRKLREALDEYHFILHCMNREEFEVVKGDEK